MCLTQSSSTSSSSSDDEMKSNSNYRQLEIEQENIAEPEISLKVCEIANISQSNNTNFENGVQVGNGFVKKTSTSSLSTSISQRSSLTSHNMGIISMTEESSSQSFNHTEKKKNYFGVDREQDTSDKQKISISSSSSEVTDATANQGPEKPIGNGQVGNERFIPLLITNRPYENDTII